MIIRDMVADDLTRGFLETLAALSPVPLSDNDSYETRARRNATRTIITLVGINEENGGVIATASLLIEEKFSHGGGLAAHLEDVAVHEKFHGFGFGRQIVAEAIERARSIGAFKIILDCDPKLTAFYQKFGFYENGVAMRMDI